MNNKGVSEVIATVLIIVITIAAAGVIWTAVVPLVRDNLTLTDVCSKADVSITQTQGYTCYDPVKKVLIIQLEKGSENINISEVKFILDSEGNSESFIEQLNVSPNSQKVFYFFPDNSPSKVSISPIVSSDNNEKECGISSFIEIQNCDLTSINLENGLISYWRFEDNVLDSLGQSDGVFNGGSPVYVSGRNGIGKAISLDGINDYIIISPSTNSNLWNKINSSFTISVWFNWNSIQKSGTQYVLFWRNDERPAIKINNNTNFLQISGINASLTPLLNNWYNIIMVYNGTHATGYVNGTQAFLPTVNNVVPNNNLTYLGKDDAASGRNFNGTIDEFMMFNYALNFTQVQDLYNSQK